MDEEGKEEEGKGCTIFYAEEEKVLEQWEDLKAEINVPTLRTLTFHQLWANMLVQYADEYAL
eukprot:jgi/Chrpa1/14232/Chrysochromulina_OHIO_Genome00020592-RA